MEPRDKFQGVVCCCLDSDRSVEDTIHKLIELKIPSCDYTINCFNIDLKNKYYQATIQLIDYEDLTLLKREKDSPESDDDDILCDCHAIILYGNGQTLTESRLNDMIEELAEVGGEPRILLYDGIDEECQPYGSLLDWSIKNGYDLIDASDEGAPKQLVDSLSAYRWIHRSDRSPVNTTTNATTTTTTTTTTSESKDKPKLNEELMQKLADFDTLLGKLSAYRDRPELRGNPDDKNIVEIADLLSGLLGDDVDDDFLEAGESSNVDSGPGDST